MKGNRLLVSQMKHLRTLPFLPISFWGQHMDIHAQAEGDNPTVLLAEWYHKADVLYKVLQLPLKQLRFNPRDLLMAEGHNLASPNLVPPSVGSVLSFYFHTV